MQRQPSADKIIAYVHDILLQGMTKKDSYQKNINNSISNVHRSIGALERTQTFKDIYASIITDDNLRMKEKVAKVKSKYLGLIELNIDTMTNVLKEAAKSEGENSLKDKAIAVRLANETVGAMAIVDGPNNAQPVGALKKDHLVS